jgi:hypothetical protein
VPTPNPTDMPGVPTEQAVRRSAKAEDKTVYFMMIPLLNQTVVYSV